MVYGFNGTCAAGVELAPLAGAAPLELPPPPPPPHAARAAEAINEAKIRFFFMFMFSPGLKSN
ncbi:hypothetical protein Bcon01_75670 [Burkholderia contaminans]|nr:hypothetical protein Bcon01_75670 [Burkholderia contaminans]